jgi:hypothetical protein
MTMQSDSKGHGLFSKPSAQMAVLSAVIIVMIVVAANYIW